MSTLTGFTVIVPSSLVVFRFDTYSTYNSVTHTIGANNSGSRNVSDCTISSVLRLANPSIIPMKLTTGKAPFSSKFWRCITCIHISRFISLCFLIEVQTHKYCFEHT